MAFSLTNLSIKDLIWTSGTKGYCNTKMTRLKNCLWLILNFYFLLVYSGSRWRKFSIVFAQVDFGNYNIFNKYKVFIKRSPWYCLENINILACLFKDLKIGAFLSYLYPLYFNISSSIFIYRWGIWWSSPLNELIIYYIFS